MTMELDVTNDEQIRSVVREVIHAQGRIDGLINNAGYGYRAAV